MAQVAARTLLTYLVHSSVLLGLALLASAVLRGRRLALQEALLRAALLGGLATSALQVGLGLEPLGGQLRLPVPLVLERSPEPHAGAASSALATLPARVSPASAGAAGAARAPARPAVRWETRVALAPSLGERLFRAALSWRTLLALAWATAALLGLARLLVAGARLRQLLHGRSRIASDALARELPAVAEKLGIRGPVRLSAVPRLAAPLATGLLRPEVCLPTRALVEMDSEQQLALCAHELAHVARRDPAWILLVRSVEALAPLQPLNAWARRRLQDLAECLSDDLAVAASARPLGLARSLLDVAAWTIGENTVLPLTAAGALDRRSRLGHRVERLMDPVRMPERRNRLLLPVAALLVLASALVTPVVSGGSSPADPPKQAVVAPAPPTPPAAPPPVLEAPPAPELPAAPVPAVRPAPAGAEAADLEKLTRAIGVRARQHEAELSRLEAQIEAFAATLAPKQAELDRMAAEIGRAAEDLARAKIDSAADAKSERSAAAAAHLAELDAKLKALTSQLHVPKEEIRALAETSRALAESIRPTEDELRELRRLSRDLARAATPDPVELARIRREAMDQAHAGARQAREAMRQAEQQLRRAQEEARREQERARSADEQGQRDPR